ncbi:hypothetical protein FRC08_014576 [Ceratobasidium sp. 394]|nr:hypothetical protein FRC08_014576 [Ceratobasidium sp. 394]
MIVPGIAGTIAGANLSCFASRTHLVLGHLASRRYTHPSPPRPKTLNISPFSRPFEDFFESPSDSSRITRASFEPFANRGLPVLLQANLVSETSSDTYEITEKGSAVLEELEKRMATAKASIDPWSSFFGPNLRGRPDRPQAAAIFRGSRASLKTLWTDLGTSVHEVEEPTYLRPAPTGLKYHLYVSMQEGSQTLLRCSSCSTTQLEYYALTRLESPPLAASSEPAHVNVSLSALRHPICDVFYALVTGPGAISHEDRIRAALLASVDDQTSSSPSSVPARILVDDAANLALSGQRARHWFDRLRLSIEQACPRVMDGRIAELDRHPGRIFASTAPGTSMTGGPLTLVPHHGQAKRGYVQGFVLGNFRTAGTTPGETCQACYRPLERVKASWVAKVALSGGETDHGGEDGEVTVRVLDPLPMLAALAAAGVLVS